MQDTGTLSCGHLQNPATGRPGATPPEWFCDLCAAHITTALDQEIAAARDAAQQRDEAWD